MSVLELKGVTKVFGEQPEKALELINNGVSKIDILNELGLTVGLKDVNLNINRGEFFVIMGLSGSGKSTLVRCLNKLIEPTSGEILLEGEDISKVDDERLLEIRRQKVSMVFQRFGLLPHKTVLENVMFGLTIQGVDYEDRKQKALEAIELVDLQGFEDSLPKELSGGMQQRVGLARALATDADIILMDEAFSALDPLIRKQMQDEILKIQDKLHKTIVFITHDLDEALRVGDRIAIMKDGEVVQIGTAEDILINPADDYVKDFVEDVNFAKIISTGAIMNSNHATTLSETNVESVIKNINDKDAKFTFIKQNNGKLKGLIRKKEVDQLEVVNYDSLKNIMIPAKEIQTVHKNTKMEKLYNLVANTSYPLAVLDKEENYLGFITRQTFLEGLAQEVDALD
ncbi:quaternary amine ABC transporter ATP-binding protein [Haloplasma contractile]|uniref:Glycine betaine-proline transport system ATP-binding protein n=1 Tax=Haloplasma contractile SSD-17B TaxID=1033810 RepID=F7PV54_9MOLU|nr:glycine betaine/L-proline ABC transporter ATP-binding protein [Haloplasma contractile]ERJ10978.1 glycine betaine-proline transport system ATP-binding protein [Haloplasma contractile SSD-17B]